ncbi:MAG: ATP-binding protein [Erysipelotrichaceae bacterium]|nr:ATP-binding protein [Erysipelotrichaceae bacterium]
MFKRKVYDKLKEWKDTYNGKYACLLEGARRVGKTTIAEEFAKNEYQTYIKIDFSNITDELLDVFKDINKLDLFFLRLQTETGIDLFKRKSVIIFDEIQLYPKARQAIKHLVADGRYDYIETGSLISIKKNVKDILIPSEEYKIQVYPMDYEEFLWATNGNPGIYKKILESKMSLGDSTNRTLMREFRIYMAVGGMPQAVETYIETNNLSAVDKVKRRIIDLYSDDLKKIDSSGRLGNIYLSIPSQLALKRKRFSIKEATQKQKTSKDEERFFDLVDSKIVLPCYNVTQPDIALELTKDFDYFKLYFSDIGLFTTMLFDSGKGIEDNIYSKLLSDKLESDLGYLYENVVAQMIVASGRNLYYHTWHDKDKTHSNEVDFLITNKNKIIPIEVKSSSIKNHKSIDLFVEKYSQIVGRRFLFSQKDISHDGMLELMPIYLVPFILESL